MQTQIIRLLLGILFITTVLPAPAQNSGATTNSPEQRAAKVAGIWAKALANARRVFLNCNDRESAGFISKIQESIAQPDGLSPRAQKIYVDRMNNRVREMVHDGALESAATLQSALYDLIELRGPRSSVTGPAHPSRKTGGSPGLGGLVLYFSFDRPEENGVVRDESGAGNDGRVYGALWVSGGKFGGAYQFSITNLADRIEIPNSDILNPDHVTLSAWVKTADRDGFWNRIMDKDCDNGYCLDLGGDFRGRQSRGKPFFETSAGALSFERVLNDNQWHHVAGSYDRKTLRCYLDGVERSRQVKNPGPLKKTGWDLCIGNSLVDYGTGEFLAFDGLIDEVRIYNRALSAAEVKALATGTHAGVDVLPAPDAATGKPDAGERLKKLQSLFDQGLINRDDYDKKKKEIIDSL